MLTFIIAIIDFLHQHNGKKVALVYEFGIGFVIKGAKGTKMDKI